MAVPSSDSGATADLGPAEGGSARKLLLDEMLAERDRAPLPPAPVLTIQPVPVDAAPVGSGRRAALKRLAEVEALARNNLRAAEEARRVMYSERQLLEEEASARTRAEHTAGALRRELERLRSTEEQRAAQARFAAADQARSELANEMEQVHDEHTRVVDELDRMRGTLLDHDSLLDEYSQRLHEEQEAQAKARADVVRAEEAQRLAERNLEIATETARRRAEDDRARYIKVEQELHDCLVERDRATTELRALTEGDGELARLRREAEATHEDMTRLLADLDVQAARADSAESDLATTLEACGQAERVAADAVEARDLAGIALETTRCELADRSEELDAERTLAQERVADLNAQLSTITRTAESATDRVVDLEARLAETVEARDEASTRAESLGEQLARAVADADQLRTHAASIGDELAATHLALEDSRAQLEAVRGELEVARRRPVELPAVSVPAETTVVEAADPAVAAITAETADVAAEPVAVELRVSEPGASEPGVIEPAAAAATTEPEPETRKSPSTKAPSSKFESAIASAFGATVDPLAARRAKRGSSARREAAARESKPEATTFRTVESHLERTKPGGPEIEREAALLRQVAPVDPEPAAGAVAPFDAPGTSGADQPVDPEQPDAQATAEPESWRRTAMAALTALAADSDDLTPRRRR